MKVFSFLYAWCIQCLVVLSIPAPPINNLQPIQPPANPVPLSSWSSTFPGLKLVPNAASGGLVPQYEPSVHAARSNHLAALAAAVDKDDDISPSDQIANHFTKLHEAAIEKAANHLWPEKLTYAGLTGETAADTVSSNPSSTYPVTFSTSVYSSDNLPPISVSMPADKTYIAPASTYYIGMAPSARFPAATSPIIPNTNSVVPASQFYHDLGSSTIFSTRVSSPSTTLTGVISSFTYITPASSYAAGVAFPSTKSTGVIPSLTYITPASSFTTGVALPFIFSKGVIPSLTYITPASTFAKGFIPQVGIYLSSGNAASVTKDESENAEMLLGKDVTAKKLILN